MSEFEPPGQQLGVNVLFLALLVVVVGSLAGQWLSVQNKLSDQASFYFGHQGYEYVDLGRVWQLALFAGLLLWFGLMVRAFLPALRRRDEQEQLVTLLVVSAAIALFYGAGLTSWATTKECVGLEHKHCASVVNAATGAMATTAVETSGVCWRRNCIVAFPSLSPSLPQSAPIEYH